MRRLPLFVAILLLSWLAGSSVRAQVDPAQLSRLSGAEVVAQDVAGTFLGLVAPADDPRSIFNVDGDYGGTEHANSIWNPEGAFGRLTGPFSPHNPLSTQPPRIVRDGMLVGYLSANGEIYGALEPFQLRKIQDQIKPAPDGC